MKFLKNAPVYLLIALLLGLFIWAVFSPKEDFVAKITKTLEGQKGIADLFFSGVTVAEISDGKKYWELVAKTSSFNKEEDITTLSTVKGTFFQEDKGSLKIISPSAVWYMALREILLDEPIGYDTKFERQFKGKIEDLKDIKDPRAVFNLPENSTAGDNGYWFKAHNLKWKLSDQKLVCRDGIMLTKGKVVVTSDALEGDVAMEHVILTGSPHALVDSISFEATTMEVDSKNDLLLAYGRIKATRHDGTIIADKGLYKQRTNEVDFIDNVALTYRDLKGWANSAVYFVASEEAVLKGAASAVRAGNTLSGDEIHILFKENRVFVKGKTKVKIGREDLK